MKLRHILEASYRGENRTLYYHEYYPHYRGTIWTEFEKPLKEIDELARRAADDDEIYDTVWSGEGWGYAFTDILQQWASIRPILEKEGAWAGSWEEGSHAVSIKSAQNAYMALENWENENSTPEDDWNEGDFGWYSEDEYENDEDEQYERWRQEQIDRESD